jgi:hypothetical protein
MLMQGNGARTHPAAGYAAVYAVLPIAILWAATELPDAGRRLNARTSSHQQPLRDTPTVVPGGPNGGRVRNPSPSLNRLVIQSG